MMRRFHKVVFGILKFDVRVIVDKSSNDAEQSDVKSIGFMAEIPEVHAEERKAMLSSM